MEAADVLRRDVRVVLDGQLAAEVAVPLVGESLQAGVRPRLHGRVPGRARAADAEERGGEGVVDRPLQPRPLAVERQAVELAQVDPSAAFFAEDDP